MCVMLKKMRFIKASTKDVVKLLVCIVEMLYDVKSILKVEQ